MRRSRIASAGLVCLVFAGCASPARPTNMVPTDLDVGVRHNRTVSTTVTGGEITSPLGQSKISNEGFQEALEQAITETGVFEAVVRVGGEDYRLEVVITNLGQPTAGFSMSVTLTTYWKLTKRGRPEPVWQDFVSTTYVARFGEDVVGVTRLQKANEGAARENIKEGIRRLAIVEVD